MSHSVSPTRRTSSLCPSAKRAPALWLAAVLVLGSSALQAQTSTATAARPAAISLAGNSYLGFHGGPSDFSRTANGAGNFSRDDHTTAYGVTAGNYLPGQNLGMEVGYTHFGEVSRAGGTTKAEGVHLSVVGRLPINDSFNLLGRVGTIYGHTDVSSNPASGVASGSESGFDWSYGIGAELVISPQWSAVLQYNEHFLKFAGNSSDRVTATTIGVRMRF